MVTVVEKHGAVVRKFPRAGHAGQNRAGQDVGDNRDCGVGIVCKDPPVDGEVLHMFPQHDKAQIRNLHVTEHRLRRPVEKRLALQLDQGLGDLKAVVKKAGTAPAHGHDQVQLSHPHPSAAAPG